MTTILLAIPAALTLILVLLNSWKTHREIGHLRRMTVDAINQATEW